MNTLHTSGSRQSIFDPFLLAYSIHCDSGFLRYGLEVHAFVEVNRLVRLLYLKALADLFISRLDSKFDMPWKLSYSCTKKRFSTCPKLRINSIGIQLFRWHGSMAHFSFADFTFCCSDGAAQWHKAHFTTRSCSGGATPLSEAHLPQSAVQHQGSSLAQSFLVHLLHSAQLLDCQPIVHRSHAIAQVTQLACATLIALLCR